MESGEAYTLGVWHVKEGREKGFVSAWKDLGDYLRGRGFAGVEVSRTPPTIEDSFMARMGEPERAA